MGFTEDFTGINFRELSLTKDFPEVNLTFAFSNEESLSIAEFREVGRNFFEILHEILLVVVVYEVGILYLLVHSNLLRIRSLHEVIRKLPSGLRVVILHCRYWSDVLHFYFILPLIYFVFIFSSPFLCTFLLWDISLRRNHMFHRN